MNTAAIRRAYLDFFAEKGHRIVPSAPLINKDDPTLLFINAGMNPFKDILTGAKPVVHARVADTQKCLRVSGKHNDLEDVGHDTYHHTFFEMLGNWSFGDYFKSESIAWAWELVNQRLGIPKDRIYVTVFGGAEAEALPPDTEAEAEWARWIAPERILRFTKKDNFWEMGDTGPCGPCTEIHIDTRSDADRALVPGHQLVNQSHPQVIEIWNLVFIQFNRQADGSLQPLPMKSVDTGMGLERVAMVMQGKQSTYDIDLFQPLLQHLTQRFHVAYGAEAATDVALRVVVDHIRAISLVIADGQLPSANGAGYVLRRLIRRAIRYGYQYLGARTPFLKDLIPLTASIYQEVFPELAAQRDFVTRVVEQEEQTFLRTLEKGLTRLDQLLSQSPQLAGPAAFELYDTYGFPLDLTELVARERGASVDTDGFQQALEAQRERSRQAIQTPVGEWQVFNSHQDGQFVGYDQQEVVTEMLRLRVAETPKGKQYAAVLAHSPFYPEGGGQVGDTGWLHSDGGEQLTVLDTVRENDLIVLRLDRAPRQPEAAWRAVVDGPRRLATAAHHSATHLLHAALRQVLGPHVEQRGSYVGPDGLRFDFSHFEKPTDAQMDEVFTRVNAYIAQALPLEEFREVPLEQAKGMGAMALFGEKYGERVRVVRFGEAVSTELCGGTHVKNTQALRLVVPVSEGSVAAGVRRLEALAAQPALNHLWQQHELLSRVRNQLKNPKNLLQSLEQLQEQLGEALHKLEAARHRHLMGQVQQLKEMKMVLNGVNYLVQLADDLNADELKKLTFELKKELDPCVLVLGTLHEGKPLLSVAVADSLHARLGTDASQWVKQLAKHIRGGGGGQPFLATAGGTQPEGLEAALADARQLVSQKLG